ncbi:hypothetical protein CHS0354_006842 [Potamilus streckersoni]|uniref:ABC transporter permease n=1 Tax=Potamilus streckersoni TaxID=2493646 RepID=A0AAE0TEK0_9BIVA|nr:hypothetical protein CHS0354_006842 [Potamilus streckersoni]
MYRFLGSLLGEFFYIRYIPREELLSLVTVDNPEMLERLRRDNVTGPVTIMSAHVGFWEMGNLYFPALFERYCAYSGKQKNPHTEKLITEFRNRFGGEMIARSAQSTLTIMKRLRKNYLYAVLGDISIYKDALFCRFLDSKRLLSIIWWSGRSDARTVNCWRLILSRRRKGIPFSSSCRFFSDTVPLNAGFLLALLACGAMYVFMWRTKWGFEIRTVGANKDVAENVGISAKKNIVLAMFIGGAVSGLIIVHEVMGYRYTFHDNFSNGLGFVGIAVALLGRNHPLGIIPAAILFGMLSRGGLFLDIHFDNLSADLVMTLQGIIVLSVAMDRLFRHLIFRKPAAAGVQAG